MTTLSYLVFGAMLMVLLPIDVIGQRGQPYIPKGKTKPAVPAPVIPEEEPDPVQGNNGDSLSGNLQVKGTTDEAILLRITELESAVTTMKMDKIATERALTSLQMTVITLQRTVRVLTTKVSELDKLANQNKELTRLLIYFETFFGVLYSEVPEAFDNTIPVETHLSLLNTYLGNREAELAGIRPSPPVEVEPDTTGVPDEVATAVVQLSQENALLASKVQTLEADVATTNAEVKKAKSAIPGLFGEGGCTCGDDVEERVERLESTTANLLSPYINSISESSPASKKAGSTVPFLFTEDELDDIRSTLIQSRAVSDTRKSVFSAIRHTHMLGEDRHQTVISFDNVHINKGRNFKNNSYFQCTTEGFYYFDFTVRSYDGHYMGVALLKNDEFMTSVYADASERSVMQSQSIILHLKRDDVVWLELGSSERFAIHSDIHKYITFNGFLIFKGR